MFAVTIETLPGFEIKEVLGQVVGVVARPRNAYVEGVKSLTGKAPANVADALVRAREVAVAHMLRIAYERGANAVVGMRFDQRVLERDLRLRHGGLRDPGPGDRTPGHRRAATGVTAAPIPPPRRPGGRHRRGGCGGAAGR